MALFDPKNDVVFKALLAQNLDLLADVIERVLDLPTPLAEVTVLNPELERDLAIDKGGVLDVRCRLGDGRMIDLEMQVDAQPVFRKRLLFYWAKMYGSELRIGDDHAKLQPSISIAWLASNLLEGDRLHSIFRLREDHDRQLFSGDIELHLFELSKLRPEDMARDRAAIWARFFRFESEDDLEQLAKEYPIMSQAKVVLGKLSEDERIAQRALDRELAKWNYALSMGAAHEEGLAKGTAEGMAEGKALQLRESILGLCEALDIVVGDSKRTALESMPLDDLEALWKQIKSDRKWP